MYVIRYVYADRDNAERTADDIKAPHSTYTICCGLVVGVLYLT